MSGTETNLKVTWKLIIGEGLTVLLLNVHKFLTILDLSRVVILCTDGAGGESKNDLCKKSIAIITSVQFHYGNIK